MPDVLSELRSSLEKRLRELEPLIKEHAQVRKALDALEGVGKRARGTAAAQRAFAKRQGATAPRRAGRPRGTGGRAQEVLALVHKHPGITIAELAKRMKIKPNYLYRVLPHLEKDGKLTSATRATTRQRAERPGGDTARIGGRVRLGSLVPRGCGLGGRRFKSDRPDSS